MGRGNGMRKNSSVEVVCWGDIKASVKPLAPDLYEGIEAISGVDQFPLIRARYPYGATIAKRGKFYVPVNGCSIDFNHPSIAPGLKSLLNYPWKVGPFGMVTHNVCEAFVEMPTHLVPQTLYRAGDVFSLLSLFEEKGLANIVENAYSVSSGSRNLFTLPQIAHSEYNQRLAKHYGINIPLCPQSLSEQWHLFHEIANSEQCDRAWYCEVIYFSKHFIQAMGSCVSFRNTLASRGWGISAFQTYQMAYDAAWAVFVQEHCPLTIKNNVLVMQTINHLLKVCMGQTAAFVPTTGDDTAPTDALTDALLNHYRIRYYWPIFMHAAPCDFSLPMYHSLFKPSFLHPLANKAIPNTLPDIIAVKAIMDRFIEYLLQDKLCFSLVGTTLHDRLSSLEFDYFHPKGTDGVRQDIASLAKDDPRFMQVPRQINTKKTYGFPVHSDFFRGCIRIRPKQKIPV